MKVFSQFIFCLLLFSEAIPVLMAADLLDPRNLRDENTVLLREGSLLPPAPRLSYSTVARSYSMTMSQETFLAPSEFLKEKALNDYEALCNLALFYSDRKGVVAEKDGHLSESQLEMKLKADALSAVRGNNLSKVMQEMKRFLEKAGACLKEKELPGEIQGEDSLAHLRKEATDQCNYLYNLAKFYNPAGKAGLLGKYSGQKEEDVEKFLCAQALRAVDKGSVVILLDRLSQITTSAETSLIETEERRRSLSIINLPPSSPVQTTKTEDPETKGAILSVNEPLQHSAVVCETNLFEKAQHNRNLSTPPNLKNPSESLKDSSPIKLASVDLMESVPLYSTGSSFQEEEGEISKPSSERHSVTLGSLIKVDSPIDKEITPFRRTQSSISEDESPGNLPGWGCPCAIM